MDTAAGFGTGSDSGTDEGSGRDRITDRIGKLFAKAESVAGTPEEQVFLDKAYALLAKHGIEEALARTGVDAARAAEIVESVTELRGKYLSDQEVLFSAIALTLHCACVRSRYGTGPIEMRLYGARRHVERVEMLFGHLVALMMGGAALQRSPEPGIATVTYRQSYMRGFALEVRARLAAAEAEAVVEAGESSGAEMVLRSDAARAVEELHRRHRRLGVARTAPRHGVGLADGAAAAARLDLGGARVGGGRLGLPA